MHYSVPAPHRFDLNSDNDVWFMCDELTRRHGIEQNTPFKESQQIFGIKFDPHALPFDIELRQIYKPVSSVYWDWMHVYLTSSGLMQYHLNEMFLDIQSEGVTLSALGQMMAVFVRSNRTQLRQLSENYIQKHVIQKRGEHMKGFAGEMVTVLIFLNYFCVRTLVPERKLVDKSRAICMAYGIIMLLRTGDDAVRRAAELERMILEYHKTLETLYSRDILKIKAHLQHHLPRCMSTVGFGLSCWSNERRNRLLIKVAKHYTRAASHNSETSLSILCRLLLDLEHRLKTSTFVEMELIHRKGVRPKASPEIAEYLPNNIMKTTIYTSTKARLRHFILKSGDLVMLETQAGAQCFAVVELCVQALEMHTHRHVLLIAARYMQPCGRTPTGHGSENVVLAPPPHLIILSVVRGQWWSVARGAPCRSQWAPGTLQNSFQNHWQAASYTSALKTSGFLRWR